MRSRPDIHLIIEDVNPAFRRCWSLLDLDQVASVELRPPAAGDPVAGAAHSSGITAGGDRPDFADGPPRC